MQPRQESQRTRSPDTEESAAPSAEPTVATSNGPVDGTPLLDDQLNTLLTISRGVE